MLLYICGTKILNQHGSLDFRYWSLSTTTIRQCVSTTEANFLIYFVDSNSESKFDRRFGFQRWDRIDDHNFDLILIQFNLITIKIDRFWSFLIIFDSKIKKDHLNVNYLIEKVDLYQKWLKRTKFWLNSTICV